MDKSPQKTSLNKAKLLSGGVAIAFGAIISLDVTIRLSYTGNFLTSYNYHRLILVLIFLAGTGILAWVSAHLIRIFIRQIKTKDGVKFFAAMLILETILLVALYLFQLPNPFKPLSWIQGTKGFILKASDLFILLIAIPGILFELILGYKDKFKEKISQWLQPERIHLFYNQLFISIFVIAGLTSFFTSPGINILNNKMSIGGSNWLKSTFEKIRYQLGDQVYDLTLVAKDKWLIYIGENSLDDLQNTQPFTSQDLEDIQRKLDQLSEQLQSKGIKLVVVIPPNKNTIYTQNIPHQIPVIGSQSRMDQIMAYEKDHGNFKVMDLRPDLVQASRQHQTYFPCGTHWNTYGAFIAYQDIMQSLEKDYPNIKPHPLDDFRFVKVQGDDDLINLESFGISTCRSVGLDPLFKDPVKIQQNWAPQGDTATDYINPLKINTVNTDPSLPRLLMYRDSFAQYLIPFLSDNFSQATYLWKIPPEGLYPDIDTEKPDVVIIEFTERYLYLLKQMPG